MTLQTFALQLLTGLGTGALLMLVSMGFTITFGLQRIINIAHGTLYMLGAYVAAEMLRAHWGFWLTLLTVFIAIGIVGLVVQRALLHYLSREDHLIQVVATIGLALAVSEVVKLLWGPNTQMLDIPAFLRGVIAFGPMVYPVYLLFVMAFATLLMGAVWLLFNRTTIGLRVQAIALDRESALAVGVNVPVVQTLTFGIGAGLAGLAGALAGPLFAVSPTMDFEIMPTVFAIVIFGGLGDVRGAVAGSMILGLILAFGTALLNSTVANLIVFLLMAATVAVRPQGLFGKREFSA